MSEEPMSNSTRGDATTATEARPGRGAAPRPSADVAIPVPVWRHPLLHAVACVGIGAAIVLADVFLL
jgi:hypothetical protein